MHLNNIHRKIVDRSTASNLVKKWKKQGNEIVFTNGCFDILHSGHVTYLAQAASKGEKLIIGLNADVSVKMLGKGDDRPIKDEKTRALILSALQFVSLVVVFSEETPYELISVLLPDVLVKGGDWAVEDIVGGDIVETNGGRVLSIPFVEGYSSTNYIEKIRNGKG